jgi:hypothetical protein
LYTASRESDTYLSIEEYLMMIGVFISLRLEFADPLGQNSRARGSSLVDTPSNVVYLTAFMRSITLIAIVLVLFHSPLQHRNSYMENPTCQKL